MRTTYSIKSTIKYPRTNENGENTFNLKERKQEIEDAIVKFNEKHNGNKKLTLNNVDSNLLELTLESAKKLNNDNMGKELTYLSRVLKREYGWGAFSKYDSAFLNIDEISIISTKNNDMKKDNKKDNKKNSINNKQERKQKDNVKSANIEKQLKTIDKVIKENAKKVSTASNSKKTRQYNRNVNNSTKKQNGKVLSNKVISKVVSLGKEMVKESFGMSVSELMIMKEETNVVNDMKDIVANLENMIDLLETKKGVKEVRN